jgi:hypothetical protein
MHVSQVIHTFVERGDYEQLRSNHSLIHTISFYLDGDGAVLRWLLRYANNFAKYPSFPELEQWASSSPILGQHVGEGVDRASMGLQVKQVASETMFAGYQGSWDQLLEDATHFARQSYFSGKLKQANQIINSGLEVVDPKTKRATTVTGVDAALQFLATAKEEDFTVPFRAPEGSWRENSELTGDALIEALSDTVKDRCYTGFKHFDEAMAIGPQQSIRFIGIVGFLNHMKSSLLRTMSYNMARAGKKVLYISLEDSALNCWVQLCWLHSYERPDLNIPDLPFWKNNPKMVTDQHQDNLRALMDDIRNGPSIKGEIVVKTLNTWPEIEQELNMGLNGEPYDVVAIDYVSHMKVDAKRPGEKNELIKAIFSDIQSFCQTYRGGRGIVCITPLQANKQGFAAADAEADEDWGTYTMDAVEQFTDAGRDMDAVFAVWNKGILDLKGMLKVSCPKSRERRFQPHFLAVDRRTRMLLDLPGDPKANVGEIDLYQKLAAGLPDPRDEDVSAL